MGGVEREATLEEAGDGRGSLVAVEFAVGEPGVVVDERMHPFVADPGSLLSTCGMAVAGDGVPGPVEADEAFRVDVEQITRARRSIPWCAAAIRQAASEDAVVVVENCG